MKNIPVRDLETSRLFIKQPTMTEQITLWNILKDENVNKYYFPTPDRIFKKYNLDKENIKDLKLARKIILEQLTDWKRQKSFYENKIESINMQDDKQKFTWSIFLKDTDIIIGQITCQPKDNMPEKVRDVGWFIDIKYQGNGYATEAAYAMLNFMFNEVEIEDIYTSAAEINPSSWKIMEKLGFEYIGNKKSTYFKEDKILIEKEYHGNKELFINKVKVKK